MELKEAIACAKNWAAQARALEKACRNGGYRFMAEENLEAAMVLEALISAAEKNEKENENGKHESDRSD